MCTLVIMRNKSTIRFYSCREISKTLQESTLKTVLLAFTCLPLFTTWIFLLCTLYHYFFSIFIFYMFSDINIYMSNI